MDRILTIKSKKRTLLLGIILISIGGFSVVNSLDIHLIGKIYGLLAVCQVGFLLFFLRCVSLKLLLK
jgi:amino acid transporter